MNSYPFRFILLSTLLLSGCQQSPIKLHRGKLFKIVESSELGPNKHFLKIEMKHVFALGRADFTEVMKMGFWNGAKKICGGEHKVWDYTTEEIEKIQILHSHYADIKYHFILTIQGEIICS